MKARVGLCRLVECPQIRASLVVKGVLLERVVFPTSSTPAERLHHEVKLAVRFVQTPAHRHECDPDSGMSGNSDGASTDLVERPQIESSDPFRVVRIRVR
jgi:hypothetical protein